MEQLLVSGKSADRLILFFAGWGIDASVFRSLRRDGYDVMVVYDFTDLNFDKNCLSRYSEIAVIGWSMGVYFADQFISKNGDLPITKCVAVNGTLDPISDIYGIPPMIYDKTSLLPDRRAVDKFYRRICGGQSGLERLMPTVPDRDVDGLRNELKAIRKSASVSRLANARNWDEVILSAKDLIFPFANLMNAWRSVENRVTVLDDGAHMIDFQRLLDRMLIDKNLVTDKFAAASDTYLTEAQVQMQVAKNLLSFAADAFPADGKRVLEIGSGCGNFTRMYQPLLSRCELSLWDLSPSEVQPLNGNRIDLKACDAETSILQSPSESLDLAISSSTIQWFNSPRKFISEILRVLKPGASAFLAFYAKGTFAELGEIAGLRYPEIGLEDVAEENVGAEFKEEKFTLNFPNPREALRHIRLTGVNSLRRKPLGVAETRALMERLKKPDGGATLTFVVKYLKLNKKNG